MEIVVIIVSAFLASLIFGWFMISLLDIMALPLMNWGAIVRTYFKMPERDQKDAWLFTLLISVTRIPVIILAGWAFFFYLLTLFIATEQLLFVEQVAMSTFWIVFVMREASVFVGSLLIGPQMKEVMRSLHG